MKRKVLILSVVIILLATIPVFADDENNISKDKQQEDNIEIKVESNEDEITNDKADELKKEPEENQMTEVASKKSETITDGWVNKDGEKYLYENNKPVVSWRLINGNWFYFLQDGKMATNWQTINGHKYWLGNDGAMKSSWQRIGDKWYWLGSENDGSMKTGWQLLGNWYWFLDDGSMATGWKDINGKRYWFGESLDDGSMKSSWHKINNKWYYFGAYNDGSMKVGWRLLGLWYYFDLNSGAMRTLWQTIDNNRYYFGSEDDGTMKSGWLNFDNKWYWLGLFHNGAVQKGWQFTTGNWYYFSLDNGVMQSGWQHLDGKKYYLGSANDGAMRYGWNNLGDKWYYFGSVNDGSMKIGWQVINGYWYYMYDDGVMAANTTIDGWKILSNGVAFYSDWSYDLNAYYIPSGSGYLITVNKNNHNVTVYIGSSGNWRFYDQFPCTVGAYGTPTPNGTFRIGLKYSYFDSGSARLFYATQFTGNYLFHSVMYYKTAYPTTIMDGTLGVHASHGCIRLSIEKAKWIYDYVPAGTTVLIQ